MFSLKMLLRRAPAYREVFTQAEGNYCCPQTLSLWLAPLSFACIQTTV